MLKSILIFLGLFALIFIGVYLFSSPEENLELDSRYGEYLSGALARNTRTHSIEFNREQFFPEEEISNEDFINELHNSELSPIPVQELLSYSRDNPNETINAPGRFGTPRNQQSSYSASGEEIICDGGLIYDPCIHVGQPLKASFDQIDVTSSWYN